jgi:N-acyl-L-homoserine lactone synthetase
MLQLLSAADLDRRPALRDSMFRDRAAQFRGRLGWPVAVDAAGRERDAYDALDPLYLICEGPDGRHAGSLRLMPTTGRCMVNEHFAHLLGGPLRSPLIWEATRFCLAPGAAPQVAPRLLLGGAGAMAAFGLTHLLGVFDAAMTRVYRRLGAEPEVLGEAGGIAVGLWHEDARARARLMARAGLAAPLPLAA